MMITTPQQMRAALDRQMNPVLVAYRNEDCAESMFNKAAFWLTYMVESHTNAEKEG